MERFTVSSGMACLHRNAALLRSLVSRDIHLRYRGTVLGLLWAVVYPLMMLIVYAFVFGAVFKARWGGGGEMGDYILMLYAGLIVHGLFADTLTRSPSAVLANPSYVKKVVFPLELLPVVHLASAGFTALIGLALLLVFTVFKQHGIAPTVLAVPLVLAPLLAMTAGLAWFLAAIGIFFRDVGQMINVIVSLMMFLSPVFYPIASVPALARGLMYLNPLTYPMESLRQVAILGTLPDALPWLAYTLVSVLVAVGGLWVFQRSRPAFGDVV